MGILVTLLPNQRCQTRIESAVGTLHAVHATTSWAELDSVCAENAVDVAVVDLYADGSANFDAIRGLRARFGTVSIVAYVALRPDATRDLFDLGRAGVEGLLLADVDDRPRVIRNVVERAKARGAADELRLHIARHSVIVRDAVMIAVTRAHEHLTGKRLAEIVGTSRRTLSGELGRAKLPPPAKLVTWGRLIVAGQMLTDRERSADAIARALDFPSGSAFRNACQRSLGLKPTEIRESGGASAVISRFIAASGISSRT